MGTSRSRLISVKARDGCEDPPTTVGALHPVIHGQTLKYNMKVRSGRGFFSRNFRHIPKKLASTIGIVVDHCCRNRSPEELQADVGECAPEELATATQVDAYMPVVRDKPSVDLVKSTEAPTADLDVFNQKILTEELVYK
ncbi:large ribosomal subunit protein eL13z-like [Solanum lycopersicum]|uniref:large ribosomal subunit protein eL13z-like n=1 Tax=Solanum lycopersicum TaxID=4081 RepID=UPI000532C5D6|nr:60S ribosomal protein L13-1-like [Solanum lycopersicum]